MKVFKMIILSEKFKKCIPLSKFEIQFLCLIFDNN